ncbi:MAG: hypothetical protein QOH96_2713 [Blastocatellia bacterium]|jgi:hypothetical protein|nr:hypothetical protein [Blastocatellia bacterium]
MPKIRALLSERIDHGFRAENARLVCRKIGYDSCLKNLAIASKADKLIFA